MPSSTYETVVKAAIDFLKSTDSKGRDSAKSSKQVVRAIRDKITCDELKLDVTDGTILCYLSAAANNDLNSGMESGGRRGGYWYEKPSEETPPPQIEKTEIDSGPGVKTTVVERDLYPLMALWLEQKGYKAKDTSALKSGGKWGNPDIVGAERVDLLGAVEIDLVSCEVKLAEKNWEEVIFEAISHKRFVNRSWFCYRVSEEDLPLPKGIEYYAERYRVGVVQIELSDNQLISLKNGLIAPLDMIDNVVERIPALYDYVPLREQRELINRAGISTTISF